MATEIPTLQQILALRPKGQDSASIGAAITLAEAMREAALDTAEASKKLARSSLLTATLAEIKKHESDAEEACLAADRLTAIVDELRGHLPQAQAREALAEGAQLGAAALAADAEFARLWPSHTAALEGLATVHRALTRRFEALQAAARVGAVPDSLPGSASVPSAEVQAALAEISRFAPSVFAAAHAAAVAMDEAEALRRAALAAALRAPLAVTEVAVTVPEPRGARAEPDPIGVLMADPWGAPA